MTTPDTIILTSVDVSGDVTRHDDMLANAIASELRRKGRQAAVRSIRETSRMRELRKTPAGHAEIASLVIEGTPQLIVFVITEALYFFGYGLHPAEMFRTVRKHSSAVIALAGDAATMEADYLLTHGLVDCCFLGDAEAGVSALVDCLASGCRWTDIPGLAWWDGVQVRRNDVQPRSHEISSSGPIIRELYERVVPSLSYGVPITTWSSRGCYARCSFCAIPAGHSFQKGPRQQLRPVEELADEIRYLHDKYGATDYQFADSNFILPGDTGERRVLEICEALKRLPFSITFRIDTRADTVTFRTVSALKEVGLRTILLGIESFYDPDLKVFRKDMVATDVIDGLNLLDELEFSTHANSKYRVRTGMILFHPATTLAGLRANLDGIRRFRISPKKLRTRLQPHRGLPLLEEFPDAVCSDTGKLQFREPCVAAILKSFTGVFDDRHCKVYDTLRNLEKLSLISNKPEMTCPATMLRREVEDASYSFFDRLLAAAEDDAESFSDASVAIMDEEAVAFDSLIEVRGFGSIVNDLSQCLSYENSNYKLLRRLRVA